MPAYEYQCESCGGRFEQRQKMSDPQVQSCPLCGGAVKRLISGGAGIISKDGGGSTARPSCGMSEPCCGQEMGCNNACGCGH